MSAPEAVGETVHRAAVGSRPYQDFLLISRAESRPYQDGAAEKHRDRLEGSHPLQGLHHQVWKAAGCDV